MSNQHASSLLEQPVTGAYSAIDDLIAARFAALELNLQYRRKALSLLTGPNKTSFRGRGIDFEEVRSYQAGDDIRTIDWRVTARSGKPHTKIFNEERERPVLIINDQRQSMFFGSQYCFKSTLACYISALIAWAGLQQGDRVGGLVIGNEQQLEVKPRRTRKAVLSFMQHMVEYNHLLHRDSGIDTDNSTRLKDSLRELRRIARPGSAIYFISDFTGFDDEAKKQFFLLSKHCEITAIFIYDSLEKQLPSDGRYMVSNGVERRQIFTGNKQLRKHYQLQFEEKLSQLHQSLGSLGIPVINMTTEDIPIKRLRHFYGRGR